jgi:acetyltransferase-like isoleucine patch superfamily enzyme
MQIGPSTSIGPITVTWPHLLRLWNCRIEPGAVFHITADSALAPAVIIESGTYIGRNCEFNIMRRITIGPGCLIASGCKFVDHDHRIQPVGIPILEKGLEAEIFIGENVWLGSNVIVLKGITIGPGAIVGAGAVVTKSIPPNEIWAGVPAKKISQRPPAGH